MKARYVIPLSALLLGGCLPREPLEPAMPVHHHVARPTVKPAPKPVVTVAPASPQLERVPAKEFEKANPTPSPKQTFKQRWLRKFFRDRAIGK